MFRIKKLDIFITKQFGLLFFGTFFICQFVLMMQFLWRYVDELIGKGLSMEIMAQFFWYMGLMLVPQALPLAILLSSLITFGNLGESSELTAIKAAGISLMQSFRSLIVLTIPASGNSMVRASIHNTFHTLGPSGSFGFAAHPDRKNTPVSTTDIRTDNCFFITTPRKQIKSVPKLCLHRL